MTITLELEPEVEARLRDKATRQGQNAEAVAQALIAEALDLEAQERAEVVQGIQRGLKEFEQGKFRAHDEVISDKRSKYNLREAAW